MSNNRHFIQYVKFILGKSRIKSEMFDVLLFADRRIEVAHIPSFIMVIGSYAFDKCNRLQSVQFDENSELATIDKSAFSKTSIKEIFIPENAFQCCALQKVTFNENSKL